MVAAASLARFLTQQVRSGGNTSPALEMIEIIVTDFSGRGLFVLNAEGTVFCWGRAPGTERPRELPATEKWQMLLKWAESPQEILLTTGITGNSRPGECRSFVPTRMPRIVRRIDLDPRRRQGRVARNREVSG